MITIGPDWLPTEANVDALPPPIRRYVRALEAERDPDGMVRANELLRDQVDKLGARLEAMHAVVVQVNAATLGVLV